MWLLFAFLSAFLLGCYDVFKKKSLAGNAVLPILFLNTLFSSLIFFPFLLNSFESSIFNGFFYFFPQEKWASHQFVILKSFLVLSSWIFGYFAMKNLPITLVGPVNATRPIMVLVGAMLIFGEKLNLYQWVGVLLSVFSIFLLSLSGKKEGIDFRKNKWILFLFISTILGAISGLYDKYIMQQLNPMFVQSWFNVYQMIIMFFVLLLLWYPQRKRTTEFY